MTTNSITNPTTPTATQLRAGLNVLIAVSEAIREAGEIPSGTLYAMLVGKVDLNQPYECYQAILRTLTGAGFIEVMPSHLIRWIGPELEKRNGN